MKPSRVTSSSVRPLDVTGEDQDQRVARAQPVVLVHRPGSIGSNWVDRRRKVWMPKSFEPAGPNRLERVRQRVRPQRVEMEVPQRVEHLPQRVRHREGGVARAGGNPAPAVRGCRAPCTASSVRGPGRTVSGRVRALEVLVEQCSPGSRRPGAARGPGRGVSPDSWSRSRSCRTSSGWFCSISLAWSGVGSCWPGRTCWGT